VTEPGAAPLDVVRSDDPLRMTRLAPSHIRTSVAIMTEDLAVVVQDREGWTVESGVAALRLEPGSWSATVRKPAIPSRPSHRWTVTGVRPNGTAAWSTWASTAAEAVRVAERWVRAQAS
jgi:hypothetical protein